MKTATLKRVSLHLAFWLAYMTEDVTLIYLWDKDLHKGISTSHQLMLAFLNSLGSLSFLREIDNENVQARSKRKQVRILY
jgi:hypothetical protein